MFLFLTVLNPEIHFSPNKEWSIETALPLTEENMAKLSCWIGDDAKYEHIYFHEK